jgi:hypothetical protein
MRAWQLLMGGILALTAGCHREQAPPLPAVTAFARGDLVVVERAAAEFFEARVLSATGASLKVQTSAEGEPVVVARSDAYRILPSSHAFAPHEVAICRTAAAHWEPCRIVTAGARGATVALGSEEQRTVDLDAMIAPGPVTVLDIERYFDVIASHRRFGEAALAAGHPRRPGGWTPVPHEPILARRRTEWYSAHAAQLLSDGGQNVVWEGDNRAEGLPGTYVVPVPPFEHTFSRGDFALARPTTPGAPWERVRIEGLGTDEAVIVGAGGNRRHVDARSLVPLSVAK